MSHIMSVINRQPPSILYHYTDFNGLIGIVTKDEIWMGDIYFLNDEKEYLEGLQIFRTELAKRKDIHKNNKISIFLNSLDTVEKLLIKQCQYVFSLTEENDLLSQWRGYTNNGIGLNIGFKTSNFMDTFKLLPCIYDRGEQELYISHLFDIAIDKFINTNELGKYDKADCVADLELQYWDAINESGSYLISATDVACAIIKNHSFKEEKEWRLISFNKNDVDFISKPTFIKPIKKAKFSKDKDIISSVKIGPNPNSDLCTSSIQKLLGHKFSHSVEISKSDIPYRN